MTIFLTADGNAIGNAEVESVQTFNDEFDYNLDSPERAHENILLPKECREGRGYLLPVEFSDALFNQAVVWKHTNGWPAQGRAEDVLWMGTRAAAEAAKRPGTPYTFILDSIPAGNPNAGYRRITVDVVLDATRGDDDAGFVFTLKSERKLGSRKPAMVNMTLL
jgi:hypothetical protein